MGKGNLGIGSPKKKTQKKSRGQGFLGIGKGEKKKEGEELTLNWVGKKRGYKDKEEEEKKFREKFLNGELKVSRCINLEMDSEHYEYNTDLQYNPR